MPDNILQNGCVVVTMGTRGTLLRSPSLWEVLWGLRGWNSQTRKRLESMKLPFLNQAG
jgi:hypothetical protein